MIRQLSIVGIFLIISATSYSQKKLSKRDFLVTLHTEYGDIQLILFDETPLHKANFIKLAKEKFYDSTTFHRIIKGFMIQGGDPNSKDKDPDNDGQGGPGYTVPAEFNTKFTHNVGALASARMGDQVNPNKESSGSQFYIVENPDGTHFLDQGYTVFGQTIGGIDVVHKIAEQPKDFRDRPNNPIWMAVEVKEMKKKKITKLYGYKYE